MERIEKLVFKLSWMNLLRKYKCIMNKDALILIYILTCEYTTLSFAKYLSICLKELIVFMLIQLLVKLYFLPLSKASLY
jgi:hypothetical protein